MGKIMRGLLVDTSVRAIVVYAALLISGCAGVPGTERPSDRLNEASAPPRWEGPVYDHIVIVVEENKDYRKIDDDEDSYIIDNPNAPFINGTLRAEGASLTRMYAQEHFSQGNYFWLLSGSNQDVGYLDCVPRPGSIHAKNLASELIAHGRSFKGFSEDLPALDPTADKEGDYARKHVPWIGFSNIPNTANLSFEDFPKRVEDFHKLPTVAFVIPNLKHDMHDSSSKDADDSVRNGDDWLRKNLGSYYRWAKTHNSLLIVTFDEDATHAGLFGIGLTNPAASDIEDQNQIVTIFAGAHIKPGYEETAPVTHVNLLRTIEAMYGLPRSGRQQRRALEADISDEKVITEVFKPVRKTKRKNVRTRSSR
jgi:acid phosphatase